ncbi:ATP-dependent RNA helicase dbp6 [Hyphodiscus hymeniophilus]|uniref:ATP-dependent RNA helicase n=1 Tax=Hyphodiscus hymeniophilus TaxID=353542 RepID=A0A9P6VJ71_9HELO|nr:ATP-dependent RNA helicase dbp6 [Hyphodiscus hymeniophilus]
MSSQIYSRYIPPKKAKGTKASQPFPPPEVLQSTTKHDASSTYARYVPSKSKAKRRKIKDSVEDSSSTMESLSISAPKYDSALDIDAPAPTNIQPDDIPADEINDPRHRRLMEKREKSLRKAEKLARKEATKAAPEALNDEIVGDPIPVEIEELHDLVPLPQPKPVPEPLVQSITASLPPWLANPIRVSPTLTAPFSALGISPEVEKVLYTKGFKEAFAVQAAVLPLLLPGTSNSVGDVLVSAATGSGKTLAYVLPMIEDVSSNVVTRLRGLIVLPTRELVIQAREMCEACATAVSGKKRVKVGTAVGNETFKAEQASLMEKELRYDPAGYKKQLQRLNAKWESSDVEDDSDNDFLCDDEEVSALPDHIINPISKIDILICTPGRLVEHLKSTHGFSLEYVRWLVVDEADKLLDQSFQQWLEIVMGRLNSSNPSLRNNNHVRKVVLSATMTRDIGQLNTLKLFRPKLVVMEGSHDQNDLQNEEASLALPELLVESAVKADDESLKPLYLLELLRREGLTLSIPEVDPSSSEDSSSDSDDTSSDGNSSTISSSSQTSLSRAVAKPALTDIPRGVLVFTKSNETAVRLGRLLALLESSLADAIGTLTSTTSTSSRRKTINSFIAGKISILVASDLVSRGLDLPNLAHVINYDIPSSVTNYVHRVGRTARAGKKGWAWSIFIPVEGRWFWNEIARSPDIARQTGTKISRVNIDAQSFGAEIRERYETALEVLGQEAKSSKTKSFKNGKSTER